MDLSIIIVNWNSREYLEQCIVSILKGTSDITYEIVVIDSGSFDGCGEMLCRRFPQVRFVQSGINLGFAGANNAAFPATSGRNILFLNPDTEVEDAAIETLCRWLDTLPDAGIVGAKLLNSDRSVQTSCIQAFPTIVNQLLDSDALRSAFPGSRLWGDGPLLEEGSAPVQVDVVSGASLMIKRSTFEAIGLFNTDYFMYSEDVDLCFTARQAGWKTYYVPMSVIIHHGGTSSSRAEISSFSSVMMLESCWRFFRRTRSSWYCRVYRLALFVAGSVRIGLASIAWPIYELRGRGSSMGAVMRKWMPRLRWTLGGEGWVGTLPAETSSFPRANAEARSRT